MRIEDISVREVLTNGLQKTVEVEIKTRKGTRHSIAPIYKNSIYRLHSSSAEEMIKKFLEIKRHFVDQTFDDMDEMDKFLHTIDVSVDFREIGGNLAFAISSAFLKTLAESENIKIHEYLSKGKPEMPVPLCIIADKQNNEIDFKEILLYPVQQKLFSKSIMVLFDIYHELNLKGVKTLTNDKLLKAVSHVTSKNSMEMGVNFGATALWNDRRYTYSTGENLISQEQLLLVQDIMKNYPVGYIEDPFDEDDFVLHATLTHRVPTRLVAGNDLYSNNLERFKRGIELKATGGITVTPSMMGTISDVMTLVEEAKNNNVSTILSDHLDNSIISNLAVGLKFNYIKLGMDISTNAINELIRIEDGI